MTAPTMPIHKLPEHEVPTAPDARMTGEQADKLRALCDEFGEPFDGALTQQQAEERMALLLEKKKNET